MNILFVVKDMEYSNGGVCTHILALSKEYINNGHKVFLMADGSDYSEEISAIGIDYYDTFPIKKVSYHPIRIFKFYRYLLAFCKKNKIDIIHLHTQSGIVPAHLVKKKLKVPFVWTNHVDAIPKAFALRLMQHILKFPIISVSESLKRDLMTRLRIKTKYITVIPNGIVLENFSPLSESETKRIKNELGISSLTFNVCLLSRIAYNKGQDVLLAAISLLQKEKCVKRNIKVYFAGEIMDSNWFESKVASFAKNNDISVEYLGFRDPREIFGVCDLFVLPSRKEGFGMVCIESFAMMCPVIRTDSPGWEEMKDYCYVVERNNVQELSEAIRKVISDDSEIKRMCISGHDAVLRRFNSKAMAESTIAVYEGLINSPKGANFGE